MTPETYRDNRRRTSNTEGVTEQDQLLNVALGLGEVGELQNLIKKWVFHGHSSEEIAPKMVDEAGDVMFYLDWLLDLMGVSWSEVAQHNVNKLRLRYPNGFETERSINRDRGES